jgi:hypothetical protein
MATCGLFKPQSAFCANSLMVWMNASSSYLKGLVSKGPMAKEVVKAAAILFIRWNSQGNLFLDGYACLSDA